MVSKPLAAAGSVSSLVALALLASVMLSQNFVVVEVGGDVTLAASKGKTGNEQKLAQAAAYAPGGAGDCKDPHFLGTLGIFKATYDNSCAKGPNGELLSPFFLVETVTSPTTEFSPLFPAQTLIGGLVANETFTTCENFYAANSKAEQAVSLLVLAKVSSGLSAQIGGGQVTIASLAGALQKVAQGAGLILGVGLSGGLGGEGTLKTTTASFATGALGIKGISDALDGAAGALGCDVGVTEPARTAYSCPSAIIPTVGECTGVNNGACLILRSLAGADEPAQFATLRQGAFGIIGGVDQFSAFGKAAVFKLTDESIAGLAGLIKLNTGDGQDVTRAQVANLSYLGGVGLGVNVDVNNTVTEVKADFNFSVLKLKLKGAAISSQQLNSLNVTDPLAAAASAWASYESCTKFTIGECAVATNYQLDASNVIAPKTVSDPSVNPTCVLVYVKFGALVGPSTVGSCNFLKLAAAVANPEILKVAAAGSADLGALLGALDADIDKAAAAAGNGFKALFNYCNVNGKGFDTCGPALIVDTQFPAPGAVEALPGFPAAFQTKYPLCVMAPFSPAPFVCGGTGSFIDFLNVFAAQAATSTDPTVLGLAGLRGAIGATTDILAFLASGSHVTVFSNAGFSAANIASNRTQRVADCENNNKDISAFKTAQALVTAAAPMMGLGGIIGLVALALNKGPVAFGAGALSVIGGAVTIGALMVVSGAPVYAKLKGDVVAGAPVYKAYSGQLHALLAGAAAIIGGIMQLVSGCLGKPVSSDSLTSKVDNSY